MGRRFNRFTPRPTHGDKPTARLQSSPDRTRNRGVTTRMRKPSSQFANQAWNLRPETKAKRDATDGPLHARTDHGATGPHRRPDGHRDRCTRRAPEAAPAECGAYRGPLLPAESEEGEEAALHGECRVGAPRHGLLLRQRRAAWKMIVIVTITEGTMSRCSAGRLAAKRCAP